MIEFSGCRWATSFLGLRAINHTSLKYLIDHNLCLWIMSDNAKGNKEQIPPILQPWISLYRSTPKFNIPGTSVDISFSLHCAAIFSILRIAARYALYWLGWTVGCDTNYTAACLVSIFHSSLLLPGLAAVLATSYEKLRRGMPGQ